MKYTLNTRAIAAFNAEEYRCQVRDNLNRALRGAPPSVVAAAAGLSNSAIRDIDRGRSVNPGIVTLQRVALVLDVSLERDILPAGENASLMRLAKMVLEHEAARINAATPDASLKNIGAEITARQRMQDAARAILMGEQA